MISSVLFYSIDKAIRSYRRMAQAKFDRAGVDLTIDQGLVLLVILEEDDLTQQEIAERAFKDQSSVARILTALTRRGLLSAEPLPHDGRRTQMRVTALGQRLLDASYPVALNNRAMALAGISSEEQKVVQDVLERIARNCTLAR